MMRSKGLFSLLVTLATLSGPMAAQELEPRELQNVPIGANLIGATIGGFGEYLA